jgi:hypothetical protein
VVIFCLLYNLLGTTFFFILFEIAFFLLFLKIGAYCPEIWILQISVIFNYIISIYSAINSGKSPILKIIKVITTVFMIIIFFGLLLIIVVFFEALNTLKTVLGGLTGYYLLKIILILKYNKINEVKIKIKALAIIGLIFFTFNSTMLFISLTPQTIEIKPKTNPEIIFWCGSSQLPDEPEILDICRRYNIAFMPTIREKDIGNVEYMEAYKRLIDNEINLHFAIGGNSQFFAHIDNAYEFPAIYKNISQWFTSEGIMDSPYISSFSIDAEPPHELTDVIQNNGIVDSLDYGYENYPTKKAIDEATEALKEFIQLIKDDRKICGMIQGSRFLDNIDQDGDVSYFMRNVHSLALKWDFTITMLYRTNRFQFDETDDEPPEFLIKAVSIFYGALIEGTKFTTSELSFYQNVALEENSKESFIKEHYIFIGNFKKEFEDTKYIKDKQFLMDFDICRHFKNEKVFFYDLKGFLSHYGWEGIEELGKYAQEKGISYLEYSTYKSVTFMTFYCGLIIIDILISLEKDLV